jgi:hypothetical protein
MNLGDRGTVARITATIRMILSLLHEEEKSLESRIYENENSLFGPSSRARLLFGFTDIASCHSATGWRLSRRQHRSGTERPS